MTDVVAAPAPGPDTLVRARPTDQPTTDQPTTDQPTADRPNPGQKADDRPTAAGSDPSPPRPVGVTLLAALRSQGWLAGLPLLAALLWTLGFLGADPREMGSFGLVSLFTAATVGGLLLLVGGFLASLYRNKREWILGLYLVTYIFLIHGTPAVLYGTLRYSWAYKHVGIVDYILRTGTVDPSIAVGEIYHNWPGFFAASALLTSLAGSPDALRIATWAPVAFNLMNLVVLRYVYRGLTRSKRLIWLSLFFFFIINWVGQDYFSPQAMAYVLYLACIGLLIRKTTLRKRQLIPFLLIVAVVAASHQITPMMLLLAITALVVLRRTSGWYLPVLGGILVAAWAFTAARDYTLPNIMELVVGLGQPVSNANETLEKTSSIAAGSQLVVIWAGRSVVVLATVMALVGAWRSWRVRGLRVTAVLLMVLPGMLVLMTGFGGEVLFRAFLFAAPFIAFLAAAACLPRDGRGFPWRNLVATVALTAVLVPGFLLAYYGKERQNYFTPGEVSALTWVQENARPGSLLVEGSRNYPTQFKNYERFTYVPIDREPEGSWREMLADPADKLDDWLSDPRYTDAYVLITRSQKIAVDTLGSMPIGSLEDIEIALRQSPDFTVAYDDGDAVIFVLADQAGR